MVVGVDEVGRGSVFGPLAVGIVVTDAAVEPPLVRDSKLLSPRGREDLVEAIYEWSVGAAVGFASAGEIDEWGISAALGLAGRRALSELSVVPDWVLLDGPFDWLSERPRSLLTPGDWPEVEVGEVVTMVKADLACASVAAASVLAKVSRDRVVVEMAASYPGYGIERHKGYGTPAHLEAIATLGPSDQHRRSWKLPAKRA
jgi:ribonuclease HII